MFDIYWDMCNIYATIYRREAGAIGFVACPLLSRLADKGVSETGQVWHMISLCCRRLHFTPRQLH